jgi:hypothetical protein
MIGLLIQGAIYFVFYFLADWRWRKLLKKQNQA